MNPELILSAVESLGVQCTGSLLALNSYENRVYQIGVEDQSPLIVKFYRPHRWTSAAILEEHAFAHELLGHEIPVVAPLTVDGKTLHEFQDFRFAIFPRQGGRMLELDNAEHLEWMGRFIGRLHAVGATQHFKHRMTINAETYGQVPFQFLLEHDFIPAEIQPNFTPTVTMILERVAACFARVEDVQLIRLHGDCHAGNVLWRPEGPSIVDLDDCLLGPAMQDIWMLLSGSDEDKKRQMQIILEGYEEFYDFNRRERHLIEALRALRMLHYAGWLAKRWDDPAFPLNFPWFNTPRYWQEQLQHLREQLDVLDAALEK